MYPVIGVPLSGGSWIRFLYRVLFLWVIKLSSLYNELVFDISDLTKGINLVSNFSFRQAYSESANYCMNDLLLIPEQNIAYTIQSSKNDKK